MKTFKEAPPGQSQDPAEENGTEMLREEKQAQFGAGIVQAWMGLYSGKWEAEKGKVSPTLPAVHFLPAVSFPSPQLPLFLNSAGSPWELKWMH